MPELDPALRDVVKKLNIGGYKRHFLLCTGPKCCDEKTGLALWDFVKRRLKELNLANHSVYRSKVGCLRVCQQGPIGLVYPEGTWYYHLTEAACEQIIQEHLINGRPVKEFMMAENPL